MESNEFEIEQRPKKNSKWLIVTIVLTIITFLSISLITYNLTKPTADQTEKRVEITSGQSVRSIAKTIKESGVVRSEIILYAAITHFYDPTNIYAGTYIFSGKENVFAVAHKLASKEIENDLTTITFPEGITARQIAAIAEDKLPEFSKEEYIELTKDKEGYLFPETYFVPPDYTAADIYALQLATYEEKLSEIKALLEQSNFTEIEVLTLASIIEREANDRDSMKMVSSVLKNRIEIGMPLQADATIEYVLDTPLNELPAGQLAVQLRETDSPYNTYLYKGLPPTPIGNPGLNAIEAVLEPAQSDYFYYITGNDGVFYYAKTLNEHNRNIELYLRP